jgi:polysaccharide deacetylase family protein (PEP-CTERM system associated)
MEPRTLSSGVSQRHRADDPDGSSLLNALSIDVEDYYHVAGFESVIRFEDWGRYESRVERNTHRILDLLDAHRSKATFFILGWVGERFPKLVREIHERGHEIASHGYSHQRVYVQTPDLFRKETRRAKGILEDAIGHPIFGYRAASYSIITKSLWALDILKDEGFVYDSSIFPVYHDRYGIPDYHRFCHILTQDPGHGLIEFPLSTLHLAGFNIPIAGGGYFRLYPYRFIRWGIRCLNQNEKQPGVIYLHPWEIDPQQPRIRASALSRFRQYLNLGGMETKLIRLLNDFRFGTMLDVLILQGLVKTNPPVQ